MENLISARGVSVTKQKKNILSDINIDIGEHDFITVIGPNGAGKSVLLKCLMGFYKVDSGIITRKKNLRLGYVPQRLFVDPSIPISVRGFLSLGKKIKSSDIDKVGEEVSVTGIMSRQLSVLSGGELQRVLLARALLGNPELLVLDEPAQNLDVAGQLNFYRLIENIYKERNLSIIMVSHDLHMVMASTKKVICLFHHICCEGKPEEVSSHREFINLFGSDMSDMLKIYTHHHRHDHSLENSENIHDGCGNVYS